MSEFEPGKHLSSLQIPSEVVKAAANANISYSAYVHSICMMYDDYDECENNEPFPFYPWVCLEDYSDMELTHMQQECRELNRQSNRPLLKVGLVSGNKFYLRSGSVDDNLFTGFGDEFFEDGSIKYRGYFLKGVYDSRGVLFNNHVYYKNYNAQLMLYEGNYKDGEMCGGGTLFFNNYKYQVLFKDLHENLHIPSINIFMQFPDTNQTEFSAVMPKVATSPRRGFNSNAPTTQYISNDRYFLRYSGCAVLVNAGEQNPWVSKAGTNWNTVNSAEYMKHFNFFFLPDGIGEEYTPNGQKKYSGGFSKGLYDGEGVYNYCNGDSYSGHFEKGVMCGKGQYYEDHRKLLFKGSFINGEINGVFEVIMVTGEPVYCGQLDSGIMNGEGRIVDRFNHHVHYVGVFRNGKLQTDHVRIVYHGELLYEGSVVRDWCNEVQSDMDSDYLWDREAKPGSNDKSVQKLLQRRERRKSSILNKDQTMEQIEEIAMEFVGEKKANSSGNDSMIDPYKDFISHLCYIPHGQGKLYQISSRYCMSFDCETESVCSSFSKYVNSGSAVECDKQNVLLFSGFFDHGLFHTIGTMYYYNNNNCMYTGCFENDHFEGEGLYFDTIGFSYAGKFHDGIPVGVFIVKNFKNKLVYEGNLNNDFLFNGKGRYIFDDQSWFNGVWKDGVLVSNENVYYMDNTMKWEGAVRTISYSNNDNDRNYVFYGKGIYTYKNGDYVQLHCSMKSYINEVVRIYNRNHYLLYKGLLNDRYRCHGEGTVYCEGECISKDRINEEWIVRSYVSLPYPRLQQDTSKAGLLTYLKSKSGIFQQIEYKGMFKNGDLDGEGHLYLNNIDIKGKWDDGHLVYGSIYEERHIVYKGELMNGKKNGKGEIYQNDIRVLSGDFLNDELEGEGIQYSINGSIIYQGSFVKGLYHGKGTVFYASGKKKYCGGFVDGICNGIGEEYDIEEHLIYIGNFENGKREGQGCLYEGNYQYDGIFMDGNLLGDHVTVCEKKGEEYIKIYEGRIEIKEVNHIIQFILPGSVPLESPTVTAGITTVNRHSNSSTHHSTTQEEEPTATKEWTPAMLTPLQTSRPGSGSYECRIVSGESIDGLSTASPTNSSYNVSGRSSFIHSPHIGFVSSFPSTASPVHRLSSFHTRSGASTPNNRYTVPLIKSVSVHSIGSQIACQSSSPSPQALEQNSCSDSSIHLLGESIPEMGAASESSSCEMEDVLIDSQLSKKA